MGTTRARRVEKREHLSSSSTVLAIFAGVPILVVNEVISSYNAQAVVCAGVPFGHTRPQWIVPHGGEITVDGTRQRVFADYL